jgi:sulfhydrogenase subunit delta
MSTARPKIAVWKFTSCDGCQLSLLDCEDELLALAEAVEIAHFPEATSSRVDGPYDISFVEGSISTAAEAERIQQVRRQSRRLIAIGACATAGGIQALRNFADIEEFQRIVYARPQLLDSLPTSTPISRHVDVDLELYGCPISKAQLLEVISAALNDRPATLSEGSVCSTCKMRGNPCVMVSQGIPCLGPVTRDGCGAICPAYQRGCYGCFGPATTCDREAVSAAAKSYQALGMKPDAIERFFRTFNAGDRKFQHSTGETS